MFKINQYGIQYINNSRPSPARLRAMKTRCALRGATGQKKCDCVGYQCKIPGSQDLVEEQIEFDGHEKLPDGSPFKDI